MWLNGGYEPIPGYKANVRSSDNKVLGVVSDKYRIVQNADAFAFTDALIGGDVHYETAGSLLDGKKIWLLAKLPDSEICGDKTEPYVCFSNTHDGSGAVRVCMTPVRVVCNNTLNLALNTAQRAWSVRHVGDISTKLVEAQQCLEMAGKYMDGRFYEHTKVLRMVYRLGQKNRAATMQWSPGRLCKSPRLCKQKIILGQHQAQPKARAPAEIRSHARGNQKIGG